MIWKFVKNNAYLLMTLAYVAVMIAALATGHLFVAVMALAGAGLSGSALMRDGLPKDPDDMNSAM